MKRFTIVLSLFFLALGLCWTRFAHGRQAQSDNEEMRQMYDEDQKDIQTAMRSGWTPEVVKRNTANEERRSNRVRQLLAGGKLKSGEDFRRAAFIFQHGSKPDDYLLAHVFAMVSISKGDLGGRWIAAATLDRYLHSIDRPQVFGTQTLTSDMSSGRWTQEPFNRRLIPESIRRDFVP